MSKMRPQTKALVDRVVDVFACSDGGLEFANLLAFVEYLDNKAATGDAVAQKVIDESFGRIVRLLNLSKSPLDNRASGL